MTSRFFLNCLLAFALPVFAGCNSGVVQDQILEANAPDPIAEARSLLNAYITSPAVGSEAMDFDDLVSRVSSVDADKGEKLEQFLTKAKKSGRVNQSTAKKLLAEFE